MLLAYEKPALKGLLKMAPKAAAAMRDALALIAASPYSRHPNVTTLKGVQAGFRLRQGDWRAVYRVDDASQTLSVEWIGPRGGAYK